VDVSPGHGWRELEIDVIQVVLRAVLRSNHEIVFEDVDVILHPQGSGGGRLEWNDRDGDVGSPRSMMNKEGQGVPGPVGSAESRIARTFFQSVAPPGVGWEAQGLSGATHDAFSPAALTLCREPRGPGLG
jgi:hypothetical protein